MLGNGLGPEILPFWGLMLVPIFPILNSSPSFDKDPIIVLTRGRCPVDPTNLLGGSALGTFRWGPCSLPDLSAPWGVVPPILPAGTPPFGQYCVKVICFSKIDVFFHGFGSCSMSFAQSPGMGSQMHSPPNTDIFSWLNPGNIFQLVRLVQVQY